MSNVQELRYPPRRRHIAEKLSNPPGAHADAHVLICREQRPTGQMADSRRNDKAAVPLLGAGI